MIKVKEFILRCNYYNDDTIDGMINDFLEGKNIEIIDVRYTSCGLGGTAEMCVRVLLIYKKYETITI